MISDILPPGVEAVEALEDDPAASLLSEEESALGRVAEGRRREFTTTRNCARRALTQLGLSPTPLLPGPQRQPLWPSGVVGSITHCPGYRAAAVARSENFISIGIDAELHQKLPKGVLRKVTLPEEQSWLGFLPDTDVCWDRVLFSAKESVYKAWFPIAGCWLGFEDAVVRVDAALGTFNARLLITGPIVNGLRIESFDGRFCISNGFVLTFVGLSAGPFSHLV